MNTVFLKGNSTNIRPVEPGDAPHVARWKSDPHILRMALSPDSETSTAKEEGAIRQTLRDKKQLYLIIEIGETGQPIGYIRLNWLDSSNHIGWLRFVLGDHRGEGYAKDALKHFVEYLASQGVHRLEAEAYDFNEVSIAFLRSLGFVREGVRRKARHDNEKYHDVVMFGLLVDELEHVGSSDGHEIKEKPNNAMQSDARTSRR